jgi:hypothetical protein
MLIHLLLSPDLGYPAGQRWKGFQLAIAVSTGEGKGLSLSRYSEVLEGLERIFPGRRLDLASLDHADPLFHKKITERCRLLAGKLSDFQRLKLLAFRRYQDHKRFLEMERRFAERFVEERTPR